jgi:hypothetical protein
VQQRQIILKADYILSLVMKAFGYCACFLLYIATPWHAFNQSYFKLVDSLVNFHDAMKFCRAEKGDLASISSEEEQTYLHKTFLENSKTKLYLLL